MSRRRQPWAAMAIRHAIAPVAILTATAWVSGCAPDEELSDGPRGSVNPEGTVASTVLRDVSTDERYNVVGHPQNAQASALTPLVGYNQFWFAWSVFHHECSRVRNDLGSLARALS